MVIDYTNLLILDCQMTLWDPEENKSNNTPLEIIKVDVALVDTAKGQVSEHETIYVKPIKAVITPYCENAYGISKATIEKEGVSFQEMYRRLRIHYMSRDRMWACWGTFDPYVLEKQSKALELEHLFYHQSTDIRELFSLMTGATNEPTCRTALKQIDQKPVNNNAINIATVFLAMTKGLRPPPTPVRRIVVPGHFSKSN